MKIYIHLDNSCFNIILYEHKFYRTYTDTSEAISRGEEIIHTGCTEFINPFYLQDFCHIYICSKDEIREMTRVGTKIKIDGVDDTYRISQNIRAMVFSGAIPLLEDKFYFKERGKYDG